MKKVLSLMLCAVICLSATASGFAVSAAYDEVVINEVCSGNNGTNGNLTDAIDSEGKYCDWIELYNKSSAQVDLSGWGITDKKATPFKAVLPQGTIIQAKSFLIIYCCKSYQYTGEGIDTNISVAINISGSGETIVLTKPVDGSETGLTVNQVDVPELAKDVTFGCIPDGNTDLRVMLKPTPGFTNSAESALLSAPTFSKETGLYANESSISVELASAINGAKIYYTTDCSDPSDTGVKYGWDDTAGPAYGYVIELENIAATAELTPEAVAQTAVEAQLIKCTTGGDLKVMATAQLDNHVYVAVRATNMLYSNLLELCGAVKTELAAANPQAAVYPVAVTSELENKAVYNISGNGFILGALYDTASSTYKWSNGEQFSYSFFNDEEGANPLEAYITYGKIINRFEYSAPITLTDKSRTVNTVATDAPENLDKCNVLKAVCKSSSGEYSEVATKSYFIGSTFTNSAYAGSPVVSLTTDVEALMSTTTGIHANPLYKGRLWERAAHFDYINDKGNFKLGANCGIRISGAGSRGMEKKSFRLFARNDYGDKYFNYAFFDDARTPEGEKVDKYKSLTLRSGANCALDACYTDNYLQKLLSVRNTFDTQEGNVCLAFLNGEFWGAYILQENYDATYFEERYDINKDELLLIKNSMWWTEDKKNYYFEWEVQEGEDEEISEFYELVDWFKDNNGKFGDDEVYKQACEKIDIRSFIDYAAVELAIGNSDWPHNNASMWKMKPTESSDKNNKYNDGKWRFNLFDTELSTGIYGGTSAGQMQFWANNYIINALYNRTSISPTGGYATAGGMYYFYMLTRLCENQQFADEFSRTYQDVVNIICDEQHATKALQPYKTKWDSIIGGLQKKRWKTAGVGARPTQITQFFSKRKGVTAEHLSATCKLNLSGDTKPVKISISDIEAGTVYVNGQELYLKDYSGNAFNADYLTELDITLSAKPADGYKFVGWSGTTCSENASVTVSMKTPLTVKAMFAKAGEPSPALVKDTQEPPAPKAIKPTEPIFVSYTEQAWTPAENERAAATVFNADGTVKERFTYYTADAPSGAYLTASQALIAAKNSVLQNEILRLEEDIVVTGIPAKSSFWSVSESANNAVLDVNGHSLICNDSNVNGFTVAKYVSFSIVNSANTGKPDEKSKTNIDFPCASNQRLIYFIGSDSSKKPSTLNIVGVKLKARTSNVSMITFDAYCSNHNLNIFRSYFEDGVSKGLNYSPGNAFFINICDSTIKTSNSLYLTAVGRTTKRLNIFDSYVNEINGSSLQFGLEIILCNSTIDKVTHTDYFGTNYIFAGKSVIKNCLPSLVTADVGCSLYADAEKNMPITSRTVTKTAQTTIYSFDDNAKTLLGDVNNDGKVNGKDVLILRKYLAAWSVAINIANADFNEDGSINAKDVLKMRKSIAGID